MRYALIVVMGSIFWGAACKRPNPPEIDVSNKRGLQKNSSADVNELVKQRDDLIAKLKDQQVEQAGRIAELSLERDQLAESKKAADDSVTLIKEQLASNQNLSATQREELNTKLQAAMIEQARLNEELKKNSEELTKAMATIKSLDSQIADLKAQIESLNKEIDSLRKQLANEKAKNAANNTVNPAGSAGVAAGGASKANPATTPTPTPTPSTTPAQPSVGKSLQYVQTNADGTRSCFEFASTSANAALLATPCVSPAPTRQLFHVEFIGAAVLLVDDRTQMCVGPDAAAATPATARILLAACNRNADSNQFFQFTEVNSETGEFKLKNQKSGSCLQVAAGKVVLSACGAASMLETKI